LVQGRKRLGFDFVIIGGIANFKMHRDQKSKKDGMTGERALNAFKMEGVERGGDREGLAKRV